MPIKVKIDVTKILKEHLFIGKEKPDGSTPKYLDLVLWETPDSQYGDDYRAVQDLNKEARDAGEKGPILGNGPNFGNAKKDQARPPAKQTPPQRKPPVDPDLDAAEDDIPF